MGAVRNGIPRMPPCCPAARLRPPGAGEGVGLYLARLEAEGRSAVAKLALVR